MSSVSSISSSLGSLTAIPTQNNQQSSFRGLLKQLQQALQSGDLAGAQKAVSTLNELIKTRQAASGSSTTSPLAMGLAQITSDLQSGNLKQAQQDFASLQGTLQSQNQGRYAASAGHNNDGDADDTSKGLTANAAGNSMSPSLLSTIKDFLISLQNDLSNTNQNVVSATASANPSAPAAQSTLSPSSDTKLSQELLSSLQSFLGALESNLGINSTGSVYTQYTNSGSIAGLSSTNTPSVLNISA